MLDRVPIWRDRRINKDLKMKQSTLAGVDSSHLPRRRQKLMRKRSNQQNYGPTVGCYESVGLYIEQTKVSWQLTPPHSFYDLLYAANSPSLDTQSETAGASWWSVWSNGKFLGSESVEDQIRHTAPTSQNGCLKAWSGSRGAHGIALDWEDWYDMRHGRMIVTPDGTAREEEFAHSGLQFRFLFRGASMKPHGKYQYTWKTL